MCVQALADLPLERRLEFLMSHEMWGNFGSEIKDSGALGVSFLHENLSNTRALIAANDELEFEPDLIEAFFIKDGVPRCQALKSIFDYDGRTNLRQNIEELFWERLKQSSNEPVTRLAIDVLCCCGDSVIDRWPQHGILRPGTGRALKVHDIDFSQPFMNNILTVITRIGGEKAIEVLRSEKVFHLKGGTKVLNALNKLGWRASSLNDYVYEYILAGDIDGLCSLGPPAQPMLNKMSYYYSQTAPRALAQIGGFAAIEPILKYVVSNPSIVDLVSEVATVHEIPRLLDAWFFDERLMNEDKNLVPWSLMVKTIANLAGGTVPESVYAMLAHGCAKWHGSMADSLLRSRAVNIIIEIGDVNAIPVLLKEMEEAEASNDYVQYSLLSTGLWLFGHVGGESYYHEVLNVYRSPNPDDDHWFQGWIKESRPEVDRSQWNLLSAPQRPRTVNESGYRIQS